MTRQITCTNCKGSGQLPSRNLINPTVTCTTCNGTGTIVINVEIVWELQY